VGLDAVVFDVDGTIADTERHGHRVAFNLAFERLGLPYTWEEDEYGLLLATPGGEHRLRGYLVARGVDEPDCSRLAAELHRTKQEIFLDLMRQGAAPLRPGIEQLIDDLTGAGVKLGVATTAGRTWVGELLATLLGSRRAAAFEVVITGEDVTRRKPDPEVYLLALKGLGCPAGASVAVEDSAAGVAAARAAGLACLAFRNGYTAEHDFGLADLVVDSLGRPGAPAVVVANPHGIEVEGTVGVATLTRLREAAA
jgi:HAD superfamily hydrolase (TIGR01509 family)